MCSQPDRPGKKDAAGAGAGDATSRRPGKPFVERPASPGVPAAPCAFDTCPGGPDKAAVTPELFSDALTAYLMQYLGLGAVFFVGLWLAYRQGDVGIETPRQRRWLWLLAGGYAGYAVVHGLFQFVLVRF